MGGAEALQQQLQRRRVQQGAERVALLGTPLGPQRQPRRWGRGERGRLGAGADVRIDVSRRRLGASASVRRPTVNGGRLPPPGHPVQVRGEEWQRAREHCSRGGPRHQVRGVAVVLLDYRVLGVEREISLHLM